MRIKIKGKPTKLSPQECRKAIKYYLSLMLPKKETKYFNITVIFEPLNYDGECWLEEYEDYEDCTPLDFKITINNKINKKKQLLALAHETVHVKQLAMGELKNNDTYFIWKRKKYNNDDLDYYDYPYEIEAYGRELGLYCRYKTYIK